MLNPLLSFDSLASQNYESVVGVDEAGRGALAGPVVAAAVWVRSSFLKLGNNLPLCAQVNDSKQLSAQKRELLFSFIEELQSDNHIRYAFAIRGPIDIERLNILRASQEAMRECLQALAVYKQEEGFGYLPSPEPDSLLKGRPVAEVLFKPARILLDGLPVKSLPFEHTAIVKGDAQSFSIALASIVAKVTRDRMMIAYEAQYPKYTFSHHKGYGTPSHRLEIKTHGPSPIHRPSFLKTFESKKTFTDSSQLNLF